MRMNLVAAGLLCSTLLASAALAQTPAPPASNAQAPTGSVGSGPAGTPFITHDRESWDKTQAGYDLDVAVTCYVRTGQLRIAQPDDIAAHRTYGDLPDRPLEPPKVSRRVTERKISRMISAAAIVTMAR